MSVTASLSKEAIEQAFSSSQLVDRGQTCYDASLFARILGETVLEQFAGIRLIGEIERIEGKETYNVLSRCLRTALSEGSLREICQSGSPGWRAILSLYFVWAGIFSYGEESGHDLWPPVMKGLGLEPDGNLSYRCGQLFIQCVKENHLEEFTSVKTGHSYMTRILLHGMIPQKHIDRFIVELIEPELQSHIGVYTTGEHLVRKWKQNGMFHYLPKPIQRFVEYGDPANINIAERFLDMANRWDEDDPALWRQWGLPRYMVEAFRRHVKHRASTIRKSWSTTFKERSYLYFDLQQAEVPLLHVPVQYMETAVDSQLRWKDLQGVKRGINLQMNITSVDGIHYSDSQDLDVGPCVEGFLLEATDRSTGLVTKQQDIPAPMAMRKNGERIPVYIFSRATGKLLDLGGKRLLPEELLLVFPKDSVLKVTGGRLSSEPERLPGLWSAWRYALYVLAGDGAFDYLGPNAGFTEDISAEIEFSGTDFGDTPELGGGGQGPWWLRCLDGWPIYTDLEGISVTCPEISYPVWRRAFGKLTRRDKSGLVRPFDLDFREAGKGYEAGIPFSPQWEPGVYEVQLRGPLGIEDVILPFVYFPLKNFHVVREPETGLVSEFHLRCHENVAVQPLFRTTIREEDEATVISLQEDMGEAFCGIKLFPDSRLPATLLLARSDLRWSHRSDRGLFHWDLWRCRPEEIPVQRLDEIADARVAVQFDGFSPSTAKGRSAKLKLVLKTLGEKTEEEQTLYTYDAPIFRRNVHDTWVVDLKKFSDLIKSLRAVEAAAVAVRSMDARGELVLFTVLKYPSFKDFRVEVTGGGDQSEKLKIVWTPQRNDPQTKRVVRVYPEGEPKGGTCLPIKDGALPPFEIRIEPSREPGLWCLKIEVHQSRFGALGPASDSTPSFTWFRAPQGWADWLEWPELKASEGLDKIACLQAVSKETLRASFPWSDFLVRFHYGKGEDSFEIIRSMLGDGILKSLLPYSCGRVWDIKAASGKRVSVKVTSSSEETPQLKHLLSHKEPCLWCKIPDEIELEISLLHSHHDLGKQGAVWRCKKAAEDEQACLYSEEGRVLDLPVWLEDAVYPDEKGRLMARCSLELFWDTPPCLPVLKQVHRNDFWFADFEKEEERSIIHKSRPVGDNKGLATLSELMTAQNRKVLTNQYFQVSNQKEKIEADLLVQRWHRWAQQTTVNRFLARMVTGRLKEAGPNGLSGVVGLIARLRSRDLWTDRICGWDGDGEKAMDALYGDTLDIVRRTTPKALLRDLILSEIIISWYWNQPLATI